VPGWLYAVIVAVFAVAAFLVVRSTQRGRIVAHLPLEPDEDVLLEEEGLKVFHRFRRRSVFGGGTVNHRVRSVLTNRRILLATGGPERRHKFVIVMILDYSSAAPRVAGDGYAAYKEKFGLGNGYPTYAFSAADVDVETTHDDQALRIVVPFPEAGSSWGPPPEVKIYTQQAERYREAVAAR
jgi:hypothetical protein